MTRFFWASVLLIELALASDLTASKSPAHPTVAEHQSQFPPEVAFQCGYRNRFRNQETGNWATDKDVHATCLKGKLDILKYCRKVYPKLQITNIVESEKMSTIDDWCKETDGKPCKWSFLSKSYRCLVGEFESEALLVPQGCHFGHVDDPTKCKDFDYWNKTATLECAKRLGDLHVESFSILEPCGLDMFSGVEYVCCPRHATTKEELHVQVKLESSGSDKKSQQAETPGKSVASANDDDEADDEDDEDDDDDEEDEDGDDEFEKPILSPAKKASRQNKNHLLRFVTASSRSQGATTTIAPITSSSEHAVKPEELLDIYFRIADPEYEHDRYKEALLRLDKKHKKKVSSVMKEWSDLEVRYQAMTKQDPKHAQEFRHEMTTRFQKTIAALEEENKEQRRQLEEVHQQRIDAALNERKREAMHRYRDALADAGQGSTPKILRALEAYIKSEEKDRVHALNRYRHLLKSDPDAAQDHRPALLRKLHDIDLRINGTISLLKDLPLTKEMKIKDSAIAFWKGYRVENTPDIDDEALLRLDYSANEKLLEEYKKQVHVESKSSSYEANNKVAIDTFKMPPGDKKSTENIVKSPATPTLSPEIAAVKDTVEKLENAIDDKEKSDLKNVKYIDPIVFDPVVEIADVESSEADFKESKILDENNPFGSYAKQSLLDHQSSIIENTIYDEQQQRPNSYTYAIFGIAGVTLLVSVLLGTALVRRRTYHHRKGFVEVDACTPEERHVSLMQGNGYENPTYKYFDDKV